MSESEAPQHRTMDMTIPNLKIHVEGKLRALPKLAVHFGLSESVVEEMRVLLENELRVYSHFPDRFTLADLINNHYLNAEKFREPVKQMLEKGENNCLGCSYCRPNASKPTTED